jgi:serine/threonine protein kinase
MEKKHVYAILEKLFIPDLLHISSYLNIKKKKDYFNCKRILFNIVEGLECMQANGFVHLDIKLENIGISKDIVPKIIDFDFACYIETDEIDFKNVRVNQEPKYFDPYTSSKNKIHKNTDIYKLGNMLFCLFFSKLYYNLILLPKGNNVYNPAIDCVNEEIFEKSIEKYKLNSDINDDDDETKLLIKLIKNMMKSNPKYRYNILETKKDN